jgi:hypothetical protein
MTGWRSTRANPRPDSPDSNKTAPPDGNPEGRFAFADGICDELRVDGHAGAFRDQGDGGALLCDARGTRMARGAGGGVDAMRFHDALLSHGGAPIPLLEGFVVGEGR